MYANASAAAASTAATQYRCTGGSDSHLLHPSDPLQEGYLADMLLVDGNPLGDIAALQQPEQRLKLIIKGGRMVKDAL